MTGLRSRIRALERQTEEKRVKPVLLLKTFDNGRTYGSPDGQTYTDADLVQLDADYDLLVISYVEDWRSTVHPGAGL